MGCTGCHHCKVHCTTYHRIKDNIACYNFETILHNEPSISIMARTTCGCVAMVSGSSVRIALTSARISGDPRSSCTVSMCFAQQCTCTESTLSIRQHPGDSRQHPGHKHKHGRGIDGLTWMVLSARASSPHTTAGTSRCDALSRCNNAKHTASTRACPHSTPHAVIPSPELAPTVTCPGPVSHEGHVSSVACCCGARDAGSEAVGTLSILPTSSLLSSAGVQM